MRSFYLSFLLLTTFVEASGNIGSPQVSVNSQGNYLIEIQLSQFPSLIEGDIAINSFKSKDLLPEETFAYSLFETLDLYQRLTLALPSSFLEDYFSFRLTVNADLSKDMFIFLPQNKLRDASSKRVSFKLPAKKIYGLPQRYQALKELEDNSVAEVNNVNLDDAPQNFNLAISRSPEEQTSLEPMVIEADKIETIWSIAQSAGSNYDASIYQIMWGFFLENPEAFIDENINLVRSDVNLNFPSNELVISTPDLLARESIGFMSMQPKTNLLIPGPKLTLTAPIEITTQKDNLHSDTSQSPEQSTINSLSFQDNSSLTGSEIIKKNTSIIEFGVSAENQVPPSASTAARAFQLNDLIWVGMLSLLFGFIIAFILIHLNPKPSFARSGPEEGLPNNESDGEETFQTNLSISNDIETQELDLVRTYIEMGNWEGAEIILQKLITSSSDDAVVSAATSLLEQKK